MQCYLVSSLVSKVMKNKTALSISQCIQQHIALSPNQKTLDLALQFHHKFGSAEVVRLTHEHGLSICDDVLRFRKSAAKYMADHENDVLQQVIGLSRKVGPLFSWCDKYDLLVCTPNGRRETQCMAIKFMCQPAGEISSGSANVGESPSTPLIIPRPKKFAPANLDVKNLSPVTLLNYTGPKKVKPPRLSNNFGQPFEDICKLEESLARAYLQDMNWLLSLRLSLTDDDIPLEWSRYMTQLARDHDDDVTTGVTTKYKETGIHRRELDTADRNLVTREFKTHAHPLTDQSSDLVNIVNRKVADKCINVVDVVSIVEEMALDFVKSLPGGFHNHLTNKVNTMETIKQGVVVGEKAVYDMVTLFSRLLIVGQSRNINLETVFEYELCAVPPSIIDEFNWYPSQSE